MLHSSWVHGLGAGGAKAEMLGVGAPGNTRPKVSGLLGAMRDSEGSGFGNTKPSLLWQHEARVSNLLGATRPEDRQCYQFVRRRLLRGVGLPEKQEVSFLVTSYLYGGGPSNLSHLNKKKS